VKSAYVSVVFHWWRGCKASDIELLDLTMQETAEAHEILVVLSPDDLVAYRASDCAHLEGLTGPLSLVVTRAGASHDAAMLVGIGRSVGDFVLEWDAHIADITPGLMSEMLKETDMGAEIVELVPLHKHTKTKAFYRTANALRPKSLPLYASVARLLSRRSVDMVLHSSASESQRILLVGDSALPRVALERPLQRAIQRSSLRKSSEAVSVLVRGTNLGLVVPLTISIVSVIAAVGVAIYALVWFVIAGSTPQGWTTIMVFGGLGFGMIMAFMGMLWVRMDQLYRAVNSPPDATSQVIVLPPSSSAL
jgi:hypothetical protein